ncbi:hypothetical protein P4O66_010530 [Electrophorus voltai]|uniref:Uncharacterized protein n=1 Tax=Electrophorus voltai TaxID=2609070 RepID=A0AAD8ZAA5_9TELE|nr:hypothetical protein P4O66_010530 [Electrophorus voltai]
MLMASRRQLLEFKKAMTRTGNMWHGLMSHGTNCFQWTVGFLCGADTMKLWIPVANNALCRLVVVPYC